MNEYRLISVLALHEGWEITSRLFHSLAMNCLMCNVTNEIRAKLVSLYNTFQIFPKTFHLAKTFSVKCEWHFHGVSVQSTFIRLWKKVPRYPPNKAYERVFWTEIILHSVFFIRVNFLAFAWALTLFDPYLCLTFGWSNIPSLTNP